MPAAFPRQHPAASSSPLPDSSLLCRRADKHLLSQVQIWQVQAVWGGCISLIGLIWKRCPESFKTFISKWVPSKDSAIFSPSSTLTKATSNNHVHGPTRPSWLKRCKLMVSKPTPLFLTAEWCKLFHWHSFLLTCVCGEIDVAVHEGRHGIALTGTGDADTGATAGHPCTITNKCYTTA